MEKRMEIVYDVVSTQVSVESNDFTTFEALGILEAVKSLITDNWLKQ